MQNLYIMKIPPILLLIFTGLLLLLGQSLKAETIAYWRFENNLLDSSGNNYDATTGAAGFSYSANIPDSYIDTGSGILSNTMSYQRTGGDAVTTYVPYDADLTNTFSGSFTVEAFVYFNLTGGSSTYSVVLNNRADGEGLSFILGRSGAGYNALLSATNGSGASSTINYKDSTGLAGGEWHHVAWVGTLSGSNITVKFYLDGVADSYTAFFSGGFKMPDEENWSIGGTANNFNGFIDELRISNEALAPGQFLSAIPEPSTVFLLIVGALGSLFIFKFRRILHSK